MTNTKQKITDEEVAEILEKLEPKDQCLYSCECCEWIGRDKDIGVIDVDRACCPECGSEIEEIKDALYNMLVEIIKQQQEEIQKEMENAENAFDANRELRRDIEKTIERFEHKFLQEYAQDIEPYKQKDTTMRDISLIINDAETAPIIAGYEDRMAEERRAHQEMYVDYLKTEMLPTLLEWLKEPLANLKEGEE